MKLRMEDEMITRLERKAIKTILESEYHDSSNPADNVESDTWVDCLWELEKEGLRKSGVMGSLQKKGFIVTDGEVVRVTKKGFDAYQEWMKVHKDAAEFFVGLEKGEK